jgi:ribose-phosphate pyrophosphokinase
MGHNLEWTKLPVLNLTPGFEPFGPSTAGEVSYIDFPSGVEPHVRIKENVHQEGWTREVLFTARPTNPTELMRVLLAPSALSGDRSYGPVLFMPFLPQARQDRKAVPEDAFGLQVMIDLLRTSGYRNVHVFDLHNPIAQGERGVGSCGFVRNHAPTHFLANVIQTEESVYGEGKQVVLVVPDKGMQGRLLRMVADEAYGNQEPGPFAEMMIRHEQLVCKKERNPKNGKLFIEVPENVEVKGRVCVIVDDICDGGGTFLPIIENLRVRGAKRIVLAVSHGLFTKGLGDLRLSGLEAVHTTDSWDPKLKTAQMQGRVIKSWLNLLGA